MLFRSQAIDDRAGLVNGDATGIGKGRVAAALALYGHRIGRKVIFLTEKSDLFGDFYRDVEPQGSLDLFRRALIMNNDLTVRHPDTGKVITELAKGEALVSFLEGNGTPALVERVASFHGVLWTYRLLENNILRMAHVFIDPQGVVRRVMFTDELRNDHDRGR